MALNPKREHPPDPSRDELLKALRDAHGEVCDLREQIAEMRWIETALRRRTGELGERVKELDCLFAIADCLRAPRKPLETVLREIAETLPSGYQNPGRTWVDLFVFGRVFRSPEFRESVHAHACSISVGGRDIGRIRVFVQPPDIPGYGAAFLKEEHALLNAVALWIGLIVEHRNAGGPVPPDLGMVAPPSDRCVRGR